MHYHCETVALRKKAFWNSLVRRNLYISITKLAPKKFYKGRSDSSTRWLNRHFKDPFVHQALKDGYRCRSAYKLLEIDSKFNFLKPGISVVDCGASPGSWTQVAVDRISCSKSRKKESHNADAPFSRTFPGARHGMVIAVDLSEIQEIPGAIILASSDITKLNVQEKIRELLPQSQADVVMSDMAPRATGNKRLDHSMIMELNRSALEFAKSVLKHGGCFLCKVWDGNETYEFVKELSEDFTFSKKIKPRASRSDSAEIYIFSRGFFQKI